MEHAFPKPFFVEEIRISILSKHLNPLRPLRAL